MEIAISEMPEFVLATERLAWTEPHVVEMPSEEAEKNFAETNRVAHELASAVREVQARGYSPDTLAIPHNGADAHAATVDNDPLAGMTQKQVYRDCIWASDEDVYTKIMLLCIERFMKPDLRSSSMSYKQIAADCGFSEETAKRTAKRVRDGGWLRIEVGGGFYVPGKGCQNLYHGIMPKKWVDELRRRKMQGRAVNPDEAVLVAVDAYAKRLSGVSVEHPVEALPEVSQVEPGEVSGSHLENARAGCLADTGVSSRVERGASQTPLLTKDTHQKESRAGALTSSITTVDTQGECRRPGEATQGQFERFWRAYPKHEGKANARKIYLRLTRDDAERAITGAAVYAQKCAVERTEAKYVKGPQGWLKERRFEDLEAVSLRLDLDAEVAQFATSETGREQIKQLGLDMGMRKIREAVAASRRSRGVD